MSVADNEHGITRREFVGLSTLSARGLALSVSTPKATAHAETQLVSRTRLILSWPIKWQDYVPDEAFAKVLVLLSRHRPAVDEVSLYDTPTQMSWFPPIEWWSQSTDVIARRFYSLRELGMQRVGVYATVTLGHGDFNLEGAPKLPFPPMVGFDGKESVASPCPNGPEFQAYNAGKYARIATASPDFILVCDDVRMQSHGAVTWGCFCPVCLHLFGDQFGRLYSREELVHALNDPSEGELRRAWVERNARTIESIYDTIGEAVHQTNPRIQTGMETLGVVYSAYSGSAYERWFAALRATRAKANMLFYYDTSIGQGFSASRMDLLVKALEISRQIEMYPERVNDRQYEFETWPSGGLVKEPQTAINEFTIALLSGCNGVALNTLGWSPPYDEYAPLFQQIVHARPYLEAILREVDGLPACGLWAAWSPQVFGNRSVRPGEYWLPAAEYPPELPYDMNLAQVLAQIGIPLSARRSDFGVVLAGRIAETLGDAELRSILKGGVLIDIMALRVLIDRGLGDLTGVKIDASPHDTVMARMTMDPLNGPYKNALSWAFVPPGFESNVLVPIAGVRWLAQLEDSVGKVIGPCMSAFENSQGGRVVVASYSPWWYLHFVSRRYQMLEIADWISDGKIPVKIVEPVRLTPYVRMNSEGTSGVIVLFNTGLSPIDVATVLIRARKKTSIRLLSVDKGPVMQLFDGAGGWGVRVRNLPAWSTVSLLLG